MPSGVNEVFEDTIFRKKSELTNATQARLLVGVDKAGFGGSALRAQYSTDQSSWFHLDGSTGPEVAIDSTGLQVSSWITLTAGAQADVFLRVVGVGGNGSRDPRFSNISIQVKK